MEWSSFQEITGIKMNRVQDTPLLLRQAQQKRAHFFLQFGGQGNSYFMEMKRLYKSHPELSDFFGYCFDALEEGMAFKDIKSCIGFHMYSNPQFSSKLLGSPC